MKKLVAGIGINDAGYPVFKIVNGKKFTCPFYRRWANMLNRCYNPKYHEKHSTYKDCIVCDKWLAFSSFKSWMIEKDWEGKELDKDLLTQGNKVYSPDTCIFIQPELNCFTNENMAKMSQHLLGVSWHNQGNKFQATCSNPFTKKSENIGLFNTELEAHQAWKARKHELALQWVEILTEENADPRLIEALKTRYL